MQESEREQEGGQSGENDRETAQISDSVTARPETSAESAEVPAVIDSEELDHKETDSGLSQQGCYKIVCNINSANRKITTARYN